MFCSLSHYRTWCPGHLSWGQIYFFIYEIRNFNVLAVYGKWFGSSCVPQKTLCVFRARPGVKLQDGQGRREWEGSTKAQLMCPGRTISGSAGSALEEVPEEGVTVLQPHPGGGGGGSEQCQQARAGFNHRLQACARSGKPPTGARTLNPSVNWTPELRVGKLNETLQWLLCCGNFPFPCLMPESALGLLMLAELLSSPTPNFWEIKRMRDI